MSKGKASVRVSTQFRDVDKGFRALQKRVFGLLNPSVSVGVTAKSGAQKTDGGMTVLDVANIHEFGLGTVPERSFLRAYIDENQGRIQKMLVVLLESVVAGKRSPQQALDILGAKMVGEIQARISAGISPPLTPETIARKGSDVPLIDTGQLRASITFESKLE